MNDPHVIALLAALLALDGVVDADDKARIARAVRLIELAHRAQRQRFGLDTEAADLLDEAGRDA